MQPIAVKAMYPLPRSAWAFKTLTISPKDEVDRIFEHRRLCGDPAMDTHGTSSLTPESIFENTAQALRQQEEVSVLVLEVAALKKGQEHRQALR